LEYWLLLPRETEQKDKRIILSRDKHSKLYRESGDVKPWIDDDDDTVDTL
jgi:hypothetical protein